MQRFTTLAVVLLGSLLICETLNLAAASSTSEATDEPTIACGALGTFTDRGSVMEVFETLRPKENLFTPQIVVFKEGTWPTGSTLNVMFLDNQNLTTEIITIANEWTQGLSVTFQVVTSEPADIRVRTTGGRLSSLIGRQSRRMSAGQPTMDLGGLNEARNNAERRAFILHEFGHALGALHEHQRRDLPLTWNTAVVNKYFRDNYRMGESDVYKHVIKPHDRSLPVRETIFDRNSVMMYPILKEFTAEGFVQPWNSVLTQYDKQLMQELYGKTTK
jgi:hypothetical protein